MLQFPARRAVGAGGKKQKKQSAIAREQEAQAPKTPSERKLMTEALRSNKNLQATVALESSQIEQMIDKAWKRQIQEGTRVITEGSLDADFFYIVQDGAFDVYVAGTGLEKRQVGSVKEGGSFGELALLYFAPRAATVVASVSSTVWVIDRQDFKNIMAISNDHLHQAHVRCLEKVPDFTSMSSELKAKLADALVEMTFIGGETIFEQGDVGTVLYLLVEGEVAVIINGERENTLKASPAKAELFGDRALLEDAPRAATIQVLSETAKALTLDRVSFELLLHNKVQLGAAKPTTMSDTIYRKDLQRVGLLGCGGFGVVELVEHTETGNLYALKSLSKGYIVKAEMQSNVMAEKQLQMMCDSPFIVKLYATYTGQQNLYLLLELALGGELYTTYHRERLFGSEKHDMYYIGGVILAFAHMHQRKIIYRDLKPENVILNEAGQLKMTDFGLSKMVVGKTYTTCGTPDYFAPEMVASKGYTSAVDWWMVGIMAYELMVGNTPFSGADPMDIFRNVKKGIDKVTNYGKCSEPLKDFIKGMCSSTPSARPPMRKGGVKNLKAHKWFAPFDWESLETLRMQPPYIPQIGNKKDTSNFEARENDLPPQLPYVDDGSGWDKSFATCT